MCVCECKLACTPMLMYASGEGIIMWDVHMHLLCDLIDTRVIISVACLFCISLSLVCIRLWVSWSVDPKNDYVCSIWHACDYARCTEHFALMRTYCWPWWVQGISIRDRLRASPWSTAPRGQQMQSLASHFVRTVACLCVCMLCACFPLRPSFMPAEDGAAWVVPSRQ